MVKPRKQKNEDQQQRPESSGGVVLHQKLCLSIDMDKRSIYGHTEVKVVAPEDGYVALHAENMAIRNISVDGEPAEFQFITQYQPIEDERRWCSVSCSQSAADVACSTYISSLDKEMVPNLFIACQKSSKSLADQQGQLNGGNISQNSSGEPVVNGHNDLLVSKDVKLIRIDYMVERGETGIHFKGNVFHTDNQTRRARCWFPCMDTALQCCPYDLEFTVNSNFVAVSSGNLLYQVLSKDDPTRKTFVYSLNVPVSAGWISLAVAPFEILPDSHSGTVSHMCLHSNLSKLQNTVGFFDNVFSYYEDYLSMSFPFGSYKQVFIPPEISISSSSLGASMCIFSSELLFDEKVIDQTINTRIRLAYALARQWFGVYVTAEEPSDEWLLDGLAGFLTDLFIKRFLGNNEARYRRYKANSAVCKVDVSGATALSASVVSNDLYGTQSIGLYGKIRSWKAVAVLQMLEKQMGPDSFRKILQNIVSRAVDATRSLRTLSTKEFRHLANKVGNLERPFLKEFFPRWVESCGCPIMRMGISYNKRRNMIEFAVIRGCTAKFALGSNPDNETREGDTGWPGMMSIRVHEIDGMYDHPSLPMSGETCQILEIQCHSKLTAKRIQKPKKGSKPDGSDDNADASSALDMRNGMDSPLLWIRVDPEMEYLAEIHFYQPIQMWINQLEKDKDVVAQSQAIATLENLPQLSFSVVNALTSFLNDSKAFWRVRIDAAYALASTSSEDTDWAGLLHLLKFYKSRRFDADIGLPRPNDFHDVPEYFVLEAIPHAVALVRAADKKSPREAVEFVLQLLKYNDNNGNPYSDVYWLAALVQSIGELEFGPQSIVFLSSLLKRIDQLLQFDSLMPSYNGMLTISCIRTLVQIAVKMSACVPSDLVCRLIRPFRSPEKTPWKVRIEASRGLLDIEYNFKGLDAALSLLVKFLEEEPSLRGEVKLVAHAMHLCQVCVESKSGNDIACPTLIALLRLLASRKAFNNVVLRHYLFCILQIIAGRPPTLYGVPRTQAHSINASQTYSEEQQTKAANLKLRISRPQEPLMDIALLSDVLPIVEAAKDADTVSNSSEKRMNILKIRVKQPSSSSKADGVDHVKDHSNGGPNETEFGPCSSVSVDAPARVVNETLNTGNQNVEEVNSSHDQESRMTASIGSAKLMNNDEAGKELQCTADSRNSAFPGDQLSPSINRTDVDTRIEMTDGTQTLSPLRDGGGPPRILDDQEAGGIGKKDKDKERKRKHKDDIEKKDHHDDPEYLERKRRKKDKKRLKELAKMQNQEFLPAPELIDRQKGEVVTSMSESLQNSAKSVGTRENTSLADELKKLDHSVAPKILLSGETKSQSVQGSLAPKIKLKIKGRSIGNV